MRPEAETETETETKTETETETETKTETETENYVENSKSKLRPCSNFSKMKSAGLNKLPWITPDVTHANDDNTSTTLYTRPVNDHTKSS